MKKSFILYTDYADKFKSLSDTQLGQLFRCILEYESKGETKPPEDFGVNLAFDIVRADLERNAKKYDEIVEKRREAGKKGGLAKASKSQQMVANADFAKQTLANVADNVNDNVNVNDNDNVNDIENVISIKGKDLIQEKDTIKDGDSKKEKVTKKKTPVVYYPNDDVLNRAFADYVEMRKMIKKPMTERAIELAIKRLDGLSQGDNDKAIDILNQSIFYSWQGLFEISDKWKQEKQRLQSLDEKWGNA